MKNKSSKIKSKIQKLSKLSEELWQGKHLSIGRLITVKYLCNEQIIAAHLSLNISKQILSNIVNNEDSLLFHDKEFYFQNEEILLNAIIEIENYLKNQNSHEAIFQIRQLLCMIKELDQKMRLRDNLYSVVGYALECVLLPFDAGYYAYQVASEYVRNPCTRGLKIEAAPKIEEISNFFSEYYFGNYIERWHKANSIVKDR